MRIFISYEFTSNSKENRPSSLLCIEISINAKPRPNLQQQVDLIDKLVEEGQDRRRVRQICEQEPELAQEFPALHKAANAPAIIAAGMVLYLNTFQRN